MPRVNGASPGRPRSRSGSNPSMSSVPYSGCISMPESVERRSSCGAIGPSVPSGLGSGLRSSMGHGLAVPGGHLAAQAHVGTAPAVDEVLVHRAVEHVVPRAPLDAVVVEPAAEPVVSGPGQHKVVAVVPVGVVAAGAAPDRVVSAPPMQDVAAVAAAQPVVPMAAEYHVVPPPADDEIPSLAGHPAVEQIVTVASDEAVVGVLPEQGVPS